MIKGIFWALVAFLAVDLIAIVVLSAAIHRLRRKMDDNLHRKKSGKRKVENIPKTSVTTPISGSEASAGVQQAAGCGPACLGKAHNIGARPVQQDSLGTIAVCGNSGVLAVVADGMGGLSGGEQVSQQVVMEMLDQGARMLSDQSDGILLDMVRSVNQKVNRMLGPDGIYKSGSTLVAVLAMNGSFRWISVGDSRIYLYRGGSVFQLNREHNLLQEWMPEILEGRLSYHEAIGNPDSRKLTSFIGMGELKYVDYSLDSIPIAQGDRVLLMTDGVFNTLKDQQISSILERNSEPQQAANAIAQQILAEEKPGQDNFTVTILGF